MAESILVIAENRNSAFARVTFEALTLAKNLAGEASGRVDCLVLGPCTDAECAKLAEYGADAILRAVHGDLDPYVTEAHARAAAQVIQGRKPALILLGASARGKDLAPRLAAAVDAGLAMDCIALKREENLFVAAKPMYGGKVLAQLELSGPTAMAAIRPNVFAAEKNPGAGVVESIDLDPGPQRTVVREILPEPGGKVSLTEAQAVVSGGRGMGGADFSLLEELASVLGAAVGASRAAVDEGWRPHGDQVGQTGATVSPSLYIACGISGAIQHFAGMSGSRCIVAINKDPEAPIFSKADFGVVGDLFQVVPALAQAIKEAKS